MTTARQVAELVADVLGIGEAVANSMTVEALGGGYIGEAWRAVTPDGPVFAKTMARCAPGGFLVEAAGLRWLADTGALAVPAVLGVTDDVLVLEFVNATASADRDGEAFGAGLAEVHAAGAPSFGAVPPGGGTAGFLARLGAEDTPAVTWREFFVHQRLEPLTAEAERRAVLPAGAREALERVVARLLDPDDDLAGPAEPPARLHGDLWAGNVIWERSGAGWLIDPAAHGGHRESDLAMMRLFGGFDETVFLAYAEVAPLADGWRRRVALHQLPPLLVHACLFGGSYGTRVAEVARGYGR